MRGRISLGILAEFCAGIGDGGMVQRARVERIFNGVVSRDENAVSEAEAIALECPAWLTSADNALLRAYRAAAAAEGYDPTRTQDVARPRATPWARFDTDASTGGGMLRIETVIATFAAEALLEREYNRAPSRSALLALLRADRCGKWLFDHAAPGLCEALSHDADEPLTLDMFRKVLQTFSTVPGRSALVAAPTLERAPHKVDVQSPPSLEIPPHALAKALRAEARPADITERGRTRVHVDRDGVITIGRSTDAAADAVPPPPPPPRTLPLSPPLPPRTAPHSLSAALKTPLPVHLEQQVARVQINRRGSVEIDQLRVNRHGAVEIDAAAAASPVSLPSLSEIADALADPTPPPPSPVSPPVEDQLVLLRGDDGASVIGTVGDAAAKFAAARAPHYERLTQADVSPRRMVGDGEAVPPPAEDTTTARVHVDRDGVVEVSLPRTSMDPPPHAVHQRYDDVAHSLPRKAVLCAAPAIQTVAPASRRLKRFQPYGVHIVRNGAIAITPRTQRPPDVSLRR